MGNQEPDLLPVLATVRNALAIPWHKRAIMLRALLPISLVLVALNMATEPLKVEALDLIYALVFGTLSLLAFSLFAITCHRLILLGADSVPGHGLANWSRRETRFVGWSLFMCFCYLSIGLVVGIPVVGLALLLQLPAKLSGGAAAFAVLIPCVYVVSRFSILFPATAVDERPDLKWAWKVTDGNGWRLVLIVGLLPVALQMGPGYLLGHSIIVDVLLHAATCILYVIEIAALSLSYRHLTGQLA